MNLQEDFCSLELYELLIDKGFEVNCYDAPFTQRLVTHQSAMKWLRCKEIYIEISILGKANIKYGFTILKLNEGEIYSDDKTYTTFEEAVEAALKYCLTTLI